MDLGSVLQRLPKAKNRDELLVGTETFDDAGIVRLDENSALVMTVDLITPVSNDPFLFGQVAAANSLSDVFAMGGLVKAALNVCCFPETLPGDVMVAILRGGQEKVDEAGGVIAGGHTVEDNDLKYGLSVTGLVHPDRILRNKGARPGDKLILTKPLGTGVGISAEKMRLMDAHHHDELLANMATLNLAASQLALAYETHAATDITGFGLAGHGLEMALASEVCLAFEDQALPRYDWFGRYWEEGARTKVTEANRRLVGERLKAPESYQELDFELVCDPQTSGGLLLSVAAKDAEALLRELHKAGFKAATIVGEVRVGEAAVAFER